jgi:hypothetical protein
MATEYIYMYTRVKNLYNEALILSEASVDLVNVQGLKSFSL